MPSRALQIPPRWALHQLTMFFEEDLRGEAKPFAGNVVLMLRFDADPGVALSKMREKDLQLIRKSGPMELISSGAMDLGGTSIDHLEWASEDPRLGVLHHLALYLSKDGHVYTATGTHLGDRFAGIREQFVEFAKSFLEG
jgi:hypothetical protein